MYPYDDNNNENKIPDPTPNTWYSKTGEDAGVPAQEPREGSESHGVPPEAARTTWKDADYTPQSDSTAPPRYFVPEDKPIKEKKPREKGNHSFAGVAALCLTCAILGGVAGGAVYGGIVKDSGTGNTPVITTSTVTPSPTSASQLASGTALSGADIYAMACEQVVGIQTEITTNYFGMTTSGSVSGSGFVITAEDRIAG